MESTRVREPRNRVLKIKFNAEESRIGPFRRNCDDKAFMDGQNLCFEDLSAMNLALMVKCIFKYVNKKGTLWWKVVCAKNKILIGYF